MALITYRNRRRGTLCTGMHRSRNPIALAVIVFAACCQLSHAEDDRPGLVAHTHNFPEAILLPIRFDGIALPQAGWILSYRNGLRRPDAPDREIQARRVRAPGSGGDLTDGLISWEVVRTRNNGCASAAGGPCPDTISVLSVPDGFVAVPAVRSVDEGATLQILIVPSGIG